MWKRFVKDYFSYTYKERTGIFILLGLIIVCIFIPFLYPYLIAKKHYDNNKFSAEIAQLQLTQPDSFAIKRYPAKNFNQDNTDEYTYQPERKHYPAVPSEVFYFDPNSATPAEWKRLGIRDKTIETIQKYLSKGGHFYKPEDISKIWGFHPDDIKRLLPYVTIVQKKTDYKNNEQLKYAEVKRTPYVPKTFAPLDINTADTTAFIALPGIGSKLAQRIINFRNKLGGFYSVDQVGETFGLPDSTFQKIRSKLILTNSSVKKININAAILDELKLHPYIRYTIANAIIQYRSQHGSFSSVSDIKKVMLITDDVYKKIEPYISIN